MTQQTNAFTFRLQSSGPDTPVVVTRRYVVTVETKKRFEDPSNVQTFEVEATVNFDDVIEQLSRSAVLGKGGVAQDCHGAVKVRRVR